jgi:phosphatidylserine decarboxylase
MIRDAFRFLIPIVAIAALCAFFKFAAAAVLLLLLAVFVAYFFRNPAREIPTGEHLVVSPADGKVIRIAGIPESAEEMPGGRNVSIFLNIFDVHVNRAPIGGKLERLEYKRGRFKVAYDEQAPAVNEQNILAIQGDGVRIVVKQIAGLIARRVICWKRPGNLLRRGELFGLIRFGSRVDIMVPKEIKVLVKVGDRVRGGSSVIGEVMQ